MSNRIDQLFKEKLSEHNLPPSAEAWTKVQAGLSTGTNKIVYWRIAASLLLFGLLASAWFLLNNTVELETQQVAQKDKTIAPPVQKNADDTAIQKVDETLAQTEQKKTEPRQKTKSTLVATSQQVIKDEKADKVLPLEDNKTLNQAESIITESVTTASTVVEKPIVIEFTLPAIEEAHTATIASVNESETKSTGIKKIFETALDVKNGDAEFGNSLREIKNELLAFDFKKDKTRTN